MRLNGVLVILVLSSAGLSFADTTWQGIPWGSSISETIEILKQKYGERIAWTVETGYSDSYLSPFRFYGLRVTLTIPKLEVAGFPVKSYSAKEYNNGQYSVVAKGYEAVYSNANNVVLYFIPQINESGTDFSTEEGRLWAARYVGLKPTDKMSLREMREELKEKIAKLYNTYWSDYPSYDDPSHIKYTIEQCRAGTTYIRLITDSREAEHTGLSLTPGTQYSMMAVSLVYSDFSLKDEYDKIQAIMDKRKEENRKKQEEEKQKEKDKRGTDGL